MRGTFPARPTITAPFACAMGFWAACALAYSTGDMRQAGDSLVLLAVSGGALAVSLLAVVCRATRMAALVAASIAVGAALGCSQALVVHASADALDGYAGTRIELTVLEDSSDYGYGENALVEGSLAGLPPAVFQARLGECGPLLVGERVTADVSFREVDYGGDRFAWQDGACGELKCASVERRQVPFPLDRLIALRSAVIDRIGADDDAHALLQALVCGYRRNVRGTEMYARFQACGLAHLVAVSGAHLVIVTGLVASLLKRARVPRRAVIAILIAVMAAYFVIAGMPVSALRATAMSALGLLSYFGKRRPSSLNAMGVSLFAIVAASPAASVSASLALSVLSTAGIVLFGPLVQAWLGRAPLACAPFALDALSLTLAASLLSQPYACSLFNQLPLVAPIANVATAPLFPLVCGMGLAGGIVGVAAPPAFGIADGVSSLFSSMLATAVTLMTQVPYASVPFTVDPVLALAASGAAAFALWIWWPRPDARAIRSGAAIALVAVAIIAVLPGPGDRIVMLDVGQGDAILVQSRGQTMLVDTGNQDAKLLRALAENRIAHIDSVLVTHADDDHCGSLDQLARTVEVDRVIVANGMLESGGGSARDLVVRAGETAREVIGVELGDSFDVGAFTALVVWPRTFTADGGNADSLCILLEYDGDEDGAIDSRALLTGDAEKEELAEMIGNGSVGDIDILKVGHHGSRNGMTADEAAALAPEVALVSCGANNRYGHPTPETLAILDDVGAATFRTDQDGSITCDLAPDRITVHCANR